MLDRFVYWSFRLTILVMRPLPVRLAYAIAANFSLLCYWVIFPRHRRALKANLARVLQTGDARLIDAVARRSFRNFGKYVVDFIRYPVITRDEVRRRLRFDQWAELEDVRRSGRGVIIATIHFGNWDLGAAALAAYDYPINAIADAFRYPPMNELIQGSRLKLGMKVIGHDRIGTAVFRALRAGEMVAMLVDVASPENAIRVDFFGAPAEVSSAAARVALRTNAWVVPAVVLRGPEDDLDIRPIIDASLRDFAPTGDEQRDAADLTARIMRSMEPAIRAHPDQWFILDELWGATRRPRVLAAARGGR